MVLVDLLKKPNIILASISCGKNQKAINNHYQCILVSFWNDKHLNKLTFAKRERVLLPNSQNDASSLTVLLSCKYIFFCFEQCSEIGLCYNNRVDVFLRFQHFSVVPNVSFTLRCFIWLFGSERKLPYDITSMPFSLHSSLRLVAACIILKRKF